jgi:integrase
MAGKEIVILRDELQQITYYRREGGKRPTIYAYFKVNGKRHRFSTKTTDLKEASIIAHEKYRFALEGKDTKVRTFKQVSEEFLKYKKTRVSLATYDNYRTILGYVYQFMGDVDITKISNKSLKELEIWRRNYYKLHPKKKIQKYSRKGKKIKNGRKFSDKISNRTINLTVGLAISVMRYGADNGYIDENKIPKWNKLKDSRREAWLTEEDFLKIYRYYEQKNKFYAYIVGFMFYTGVRPVELNKIKWKDINFERRSVVVRGRKHKSRIVDSVVPLFPRTIHILEDLQKMNDPVDQDDFVFIKNGRQVKSIRKSFKETVRKLHLDDDLSVYSLRHGFATYLIENYNVPLPFVSKILGHANTKMVQAIYNHMRDDTVVNRVLEEHEEAKKTGRIQSLKKQWEIFIDFDEKGLN